MYVYLLICIVQHMFVASTCTVRCPSHQYSQAQVLLGPTQPCGRCRWSARGSWGFSPQSRGFCSENTNASWPMICIWYDDLYMLCKFTHPDMRMKYISTVRLVYIYICHISYTHKWNHLPNRRTCQGYQFTSNCQAKLAQDVTWRPSKCVDSSLFAR